MRPYPRRTSRRLGLLAPLLLLAAVPAIAAPATVLEAEGRLSLAQFVKYSPTPLDWIEWRHEIADGTTFAEELAIPEHPCLWGYDLSCDADGLSGTITWAALDPAPTYFFIVMADTRLTCRLEVSNRVALIADRSVAGAFPDARDILEQAAILIHPDGTEVELVGTASGTDHAEVLLEPGEYRLTIEASYWQYDNQTAIAGGIDVRWIDATVPAESVSWSDLHARFR